MKNILITGAAGGMGKAACRLFAKNGYNVFGLDAALCDDLEGITFLRADLRSEESIIAAATEISETTSHLDAIIHLAGIYDAGSLVEMEEDALLRIFDINVFGVYRINKAFLPLLKKGSRIIITTSELGPLDPLPFTGIYGITKGSLEKYAFSLRTELSLLGIDVCVLRPGAVSTGLLSVSTTALEKFHNTTKLYACNAERFLKIVNKVESRCITPDKIAQMIFKILKKKRPGFTYSINRNPLLLLLDILPARLHVFAIKTILKKAP